MTFTTNIPVSGQTLGGSRPLVNGNFTSLYNTIAVNHVPPNGSMGIGQGKHTFVEMPVQAVTPTTLVNEGGLYTQTLAGTSASLLYYQRDANTSVNQPVLPMAVCTFITRTGTGAATIVSGYNITSVTKSGPGAYDVVFAFPLPFTASVKEYTVLYGIGNSPQNQALLLYTFSASGTGFTVQLLNAQGSAVGNDGVANRISFSVIQ